MNKLQWHRSVALAGIGTVITLMIWAQFFNIAATVRTQVLSKLATVPYCDEVVNRSSSSEGEDCHQRLRPTPEVSPTPTRTPLPTPPTRPPCGDRKDNDSDGRIDSADPSCHESFDLNRLYIASNAEGPKPACADRKDNDSDGRVDERDSGCFDLRAAQDSLSQVPVNSAEEFLDIVYAQFDYEPGRGTEQGEPGCADGRDNDGDGVVDDADQGCLNPETGNYDPFESETGEGECADGVDNDKDGLTDEADPGCHVGGHLSGEYDLDENEIGGIACSDGADNDSDGRIDAADAGCRWAGLPNAPYRPRDTNEGGEAACADGHDNDDDGKVDNQDPGCYLITWGWNKKSILRAIYVPRRDRESSN